MISTLADFKRLGKGSKLQLVHAEGMPSHRFLNQVREIEKKQTNGVRFTGGSWLYYPSAKGFKVENDVVVIDDILHYKVLE